MAGLVPAFPTYWRSRVRLNEIAGPSPAMTAYEIAYRFRRSRPTMPCGRKVTIRMKMIPSHNSQRSG